MITNSEAEALLLENEQIKHHQPPYNVLLRDDKSYPYIHLSQDTHARIALYRGVKKKGDYFGPYPSAYAVRESIELLQKIFRIRTCSNGFYRNRSRPCLEYQIKRCSAPCVGKISNKDYQHDVDMVKLFLNGKNQAVLKHLAHKMDTSSEALNYESAAYYRDQMISLRKMQEKHGHNLLEDLDVIYLCQLDGIYCLQLIFMRQGKQVGQESFFPKNTQYSNDDEILSAFISQYYLTRKQSRSCVVNVAPKDKTLLQQVLKLKIITHPRGDKKRLLNAAKINAENSIKQRLARYERHSTQLKRLEQILSLERAERIECFDISHTMGEAPKASCVVFIKGRADKKQYRAFNIKGVSAGDDYAAIKQAVKRRYQRLIKEHKTVPDLLLIDGGKGQVTHTKQALDELSLDMRLIGVAKGKGRKVGLETLVSLDEQGNWQMVKLPSDDLALLLINQIRDEAHRFAIRLHRKSRGKKHQRSVIEQIPGVGAVKKQALLSHFGGLQEIKAASVDELCKVHGIERQLADRIVSFVRQKV